MMDAPRIQYANTKDGVSIAFYRLGDGPPLVVMPSLPVSHVELEWHIPEWRAWYEHLGRGRSLIRYDARGTGLADRTRIERDIDSMVLDLEAVVDKLRLERFALQAIFYAVPPAIVYAIRHPERVSHLLLFCGFSRFADLQSPQLAGSRLLLEADWNLYTETAAHVLLGWSQGEPAQRFAAFIRESVSPQSVTELLNAGYDVDDLLHQVNVPTLVQHRRQIPWLPIDLGRRLAAAVPDARLDVLEGSSIALYLGDSESVLRGVDAFLSDRPMVTMSKGGGGGVQTILFTDLENHTEMLHRLGDRSGREVLREHERLTREALRAHDGREVKTMGDGFMASFGSAQKALECAIALQRAFAGFEQPATGNQQPGPEGGHSGRHAEMPTADLPPLRIRIGVNAGEPIAEDNDLFGSSVILAARTAARAQGGQILVTDVVRQLAAGKGFAFADIGEVEMKGFEGPVRLYELRWA